MERKRLGITVFQPRLKVCTFARTNYYEYGKQRQVHVSVSGMHHYIEDIGQSVKSIRDAVLKATEHQDCEAFVPFTADSPHSDVDRAAVTIQLSNGTLVSVSHCDAGIITAVLNALK